MPRWTGRNLSIGLLVFAFTCSLAAAAPSWPVPVGASREPVSYVYEPAQWQPVPPEFLNDAPACTLYSGLTYLIESDGTVETVTHEITRFNSRKAIERLGEYRNIAYDPAYETLTLNEARVIKADGKIVLVQPAHVQLRDVGTDFLVYDHGKQVVISFPTLEVGDCIEIKWTTRGKNPELKGRFFARYQFGDDMFPVVTDEVRVRLPKAMPLKWAVGGGKLEPTVTEDGDQRLYHWRSVNRAPLSRDEFLPSKEDLRLQLSLSTFASWEEVLNWERSIRADCWECSKEMQQVVQEVTQGLQAPVDKARALTTWLRKHIRYVSSGEKHDYTPHPPAMIFGNRYGDCKDTSQMLAVMLKEAGVPAGLVVLGTLDDGQVVEEVPSPWGTHAILLVTLNGQNHWIDTTASLAGWDQLPRDDRDRMCYVVDESGLRLLRTPALTAADYRTEQLTTMMIGADGTSASERRIGYEGLAALSRRNEWCEAPSADCRRLVCAELQDANIRSRLTHLEIDPARLQNGDQPVHAKMAFEIKGHFAKDPDHPGFLEGSVGDNAICSKLLAINPDYDRTSPLELPGPFESFHQYTVQLPAGYGLEEKPADRMITSKWGIFQLTVQANPADPQHINLVYYTRIEQVRVDPVDFEQFRKFREDVSQAYLTSLAMGPIKGKVPSAKKPVPAALPNP